MNKRGILLLLGLVVSNGAFVARAADQVAERPQTIGLAQQQEIPAAQLQDRIARLEQQVADARSAGDNAWMLVSSALVLMMTGPGLALFYGGLVRK
ncbi:MAG TPA: hypothetical protein VE398_25705, partial [Acidobacteriota bacterium]|nr:hypothetical protein [Acidobacteriota bacterium]